VTAAVRPHSVAAWRLAARPATLGAGVAPVVVGCAVAAAADSFRPLLAACALIVAVGVQIGTNLVNDWADWRRGADGPGRTGPTRVTASGLLTPKEVVAGAVVAFGTAAAAGLVIVALAGPVWLAVGAFAVLSGIAYTAGPWPLAYVGLGDLWAFACFGVLATAATAAVQTGLWSGTAVWLGAALGFFAAALLGVNNLRDLDGDRAARKRTLAVRFGRTATRWMLVVELSVALAVPVAVLGPRGLTGLVAVPLLVGPARRILADDGSQPRALVPALLGIARSEVVFAAAIAAGVLWRS